MEDTAAIQLLTGPTSSLLMLLVAAGAGWRFFNGTIVPTGKRWVDQHLESVDRMLTEHAADREAWRESMRECAEQHRETLARLDDLADRLPRRDP